jgi:hypothetical protein
VSPAEILENAALNGSRGMSMRDYFAAAAIQGCASDLNWGDSDHVPIATHGAKAAYAIADAMLKERAK